MTAVVARRDVTPPHVAWTVVRDGRPVDGFDGRRHPGGHVVEDRPQVEAAVDAAAVAAALARHLAADGMARYVGATGVRNAAMRPVLAANGRPEAGAEAYRGR